MSGFEVDVVIPAHQAEQTVGAAVSSALVQSLKPRSVVVVADSCIDATARVAGEAGAEVIVAEAGAAGAARNVGTRNGCSKFIAFLDADDRWRPTWLDAVARAWRVSSESAVFYGSVEELFPGGSRLAGQERRMPAGRVRDNLLTSNFIATSAVVVRRDVFTSAGGFNETLHEVEDLELWLRLAERHLFAPVRGRHVTYVRTASSAMRDPAHARRICDQHLRVINGALARGLVGGRLRRRAVAAVYKTSAARLLAAGAVRPARTAVVLSFRAWPFDPSLWALASVVLQPKLARGMLLAVRRRWRLRD